MQVMILGLLAETFIHPGGGRDEGAIDLPVAREAATDYPYIAGSSFKGALRDRARQKWPDEEEKNDRGEDKTRPSDTVLKYFGKHDHAGEILISDARLLLLPVRSLHGAYKWVTCPHILERLARDWRRVGNDRFPEFRDMKVEQKKYIGKEHTNSMLYLEERSFKRQGKLPDGLTENLKQLIPHESTKARLEEQLTVIHDSDFAWFARYGLAVQARNVLNDNKTSENLWYEESLPPDTLMYSIVAERKVGAVKAVAELFKELDDRAYLQAGGNETVGQGWFAVSTLLSGESS